MTDEVDEVAALVNSDPERDFILINGGIDRQLHYHVSVLLRQQKHDKCTIFLTTRGGDPNAGFRIARCIRHHYNNHVRLVVPSFCKSAGTLIAIAADELGIGDLGELGPLDIQVRKGSELEESSSGLDIQQALATVSNHTQLTFQQILIGMRRASGLSTKLVAEFAAKVATGMAAPLFSQIDPIRLGEMQRATRVAYEYGKRLDAYSSNLKPDALSSLIGDYPSHGFVIDRKEAGELFHRVSHLTDEEKQFSRKFWKLIVEQLETPCASYIELEAQHETGKDDEPDTEAEHAQARDVAPQDESREAERGERSDEDPAAADGQSLRVRTAGIRDQRAQQG